MPRQSSPANRSIPVFVREGATKQQLREHVERLGLDNVTLPPGVPREEVPAILAAADACLVRGKHHCSPHFIPSKLFEYLGSGKAVIGSVRGEPAAILREAEAIVPSPRIHGPGRGHPLAGEPARRADTGARGRRYVAEHFERRQLADRHGLLSSVFRSEAS